MLSLGCKVSTLLHRKRKGISKFVLNKKDMITLRNEQLQISNIDDDFELRIEVFDADIIESKDIFINEAQAKHIVEHFKTQFGWH